MATPSWTSLRPVTDAFLDVHLMVESRDGFTDIYQNPGADGMTVHVEACKDVRATLEGIRAAGMRCGVTLNPATPLETIEPVLDLVDMVLIMSVQPGLGGQKYIPSSTDKIRRLKAMLDAGAARPTFRWTAVCRQPICGRCWTPGPISSWPVLPCSAVISRVRPGH